MWLNALAKILKMEKWGYIDNKFNNKVQGMPYISEI